MSNKVNTNKSAIEQRVNELVQHSRTLELYLNEVLEREATVTKLIEEDSSCIVCSPKYSSR